MTMSPDSRVEPWVRLALVRLQDRFAGSAPRLGDAVAAWTRQLTRGADPATYFLHPDAFPSHLLPLWCGDAVGGIGEAFQIDVCESTVHGTYAIRLIDNAADGDAGLDLRLLPALHVLGSGFEAPYHRSFPADHPFWDDFHRVWTSCAEATYRDAVEGPTDEDSFRRLAAQKVSAAKIPAIAVCHRAGRGDRIAAWCRLVDLLGCWHQMLYDVLDWHKDLEHAQPTWFLAQAASRRRNDEPVMAWVLREGLELGMSEVRGFMAELRAQAVQLGSAALVTYLDERQRRVEELWARNRAGLGVLARLTELASGDPPATSSSAPCTVAFSVVS